MPMDVNEFNKIPDFYIHKSHVMARRRCPLMMRRMMVDKTRVNAFELQQGTDFHKFAHDFFDQVDILNARHYSYEKAVGYFKTFIPPHFHRDLKMMCENYCEMEADRFWGIKDFADDAIGDYFYPIEREKVIKSEVLKMETTPDRLDWYNDEDIVLLEYKTSRRMNYTDLRIELAIESLLVNEKYKKKCKWVGCINPRLKIAWVERLKDISVTWAKKNVDKTRKMLAEGNYPAKVSDGCMYCMFMKRCMSEGIMELEEIKGESK